eukprot:4175510-Prymnesium_polylepis.4
MLLLAATCNAAVLRTAATPRAALATMSLAPNTPLGHRMGPADAPGDTLARWTCVDSPVSQLTLTADRRCPQ